MHSFSEITRKVHLLNDLILSDMTCGQKDYSQEALEFNRHVLATKYWFSRISCVNKKRFLLIILSDVESVWTLSLLLKSIWNCRPKDAVLSISELKVWSSYDQVPMDNNRTAKPTSTLTEVMVNDRKWFQGLQKESQTLVLCELMTLAGGPVMWEVLKRAQELYEQYQNQQLQDLQECVTVNQQPCDKVKITVPEQSKKDQSARRKSSVGTSGLDSAKQTPGQAKKDLEFHLLNWDATIKSTRDSLKLEEQEMTFKDGRKQKIWKVNRPKPEGLETVDFLQLLPSSVGKKILRNLPLPQLADCARVNKYWTYLIDEIRTEMTARLKLDVELEKIKDAMLRHESDVRSEPVNAPNAQSKILLTARNEIRQINYPTKLHFHAKSKKSSKKIQAFQTRIQPIRKVADLWNRLQIRGAADEDLWKWCSNTFKCAEKEDQIIRNTEGVLTFKNIYFPCPKMKQSLEIPLTSPLTVDPTLEVSEKLKVNLTDAVVRNTPNKDSKRRYSLWCKDFSGLYPVCKIPSHMSPI